jgi:aspartyl-tRNA(Asn)/glutamyl-tRNA(Gln) amidotransferase subunit C
MNTISIDDVKKLANLSGISVSDEDAASFRPELEEILAYVKQLELVDVDGVEPTYAVHYLESVVRPDEIIDYGVSQRDLLKNVSTVAEDGAIVVPKVIE